MSGEYKQLYRHTNFEITGYRYFLISSMKESIMHRI